MAISRRSLPARTSSSQIPGGCPVGGVIPVIPDFFPPPRLRPDSSSSRVNFNFFLNAFKAFLSMFPLILGLLAVVGLVLRNQHLQAQVQSMILGFFPADAHTALQHTMDSVRKRSGILGLISIVGLLWSGGSLFITLEFVLGKIMGTQQRGFVRQRGRACRRLLRLGAGRKARRVARRPQILRPLNLFLAGRAGLLATPIRTN